jgi:uncharacterized protein (DUF697 family)
MTALWTIVANFLKVALGQWGGYIAAVAAIGITYVTWTTVQRNVGVQQERARVEREGSKTDAKAAVARRDAERDPDKRLQKYFRD